MAVPLTNIDAEVATQNHSKEAIAAKKGTK
jgi:hypothetical protein